MRAENRCFLAVWILLAYAHTIRAQPTRPCIDSGNAQDPLLWRIADQMKVAEMREYGWKRFLEATSTEADPAWLKNPWQESGQLFQRDAKNCETGDASNFQPVSPVIPDHFHTIFQLFTDEKTTGPLLVQSIHFNECASRHIRDFKLNCPSELDKQKNGDAALQKRGQMFIDPFPGDAVVIKAVWWPITRDKPFCALPIWDGVPDGTKEVSFPYYGWSRLVWIATGPNPPSLTEFDTPPWWHGSAASRLKKYGAEVFSLDNFYQRRIGDENWSKYDKELLSDLFDKFYDSTPRENDLMILVAVHLATKELDDWTWSTFWWHDKGPYAAMPFGVIGKARHFLMDATFAATTPRDDMGNPRYIYNPWLEGGMTNGVHSSCITCHQRASWRNLDTDGTKVEPLPKPPDHVFFRDKMRLDYMWSILIENLRNSEAKKDP